MRRRQSSIGIAALVMLALGAAPVAAQSNRTFVSGHGADSGSCGLGAPCRSFAYAATQTNAGGEITILDPAGYGTVTITKALSIINDGVGEAGVTVNTNPGVAITINAGPSDVVTLRGLTLVNSGGANALGIFFIAGGAMNVQNCVIRGFDEYGILAEANGGSQTFQFSDTIVANNGAGIVLENVGSGSLTAALERVQAIGNNINGVSTTGSAGSVKVTVADSLAGGNLSAGFQVFQSSGGGSSTLLVVNSKAVNNGIGVEASGANGTLVIDQSTVSGNATGFATFNGGVIKSFGNNAIVDASNSGALTPIGVQ